MQRRQYDEHCGSPPASQPDPYAGMPPIGFAMITKSDYKPNHPQGFDFSKLPAPPSNPNFPYPASGASGGCDQGPYGQPSGPGTYPTSMPVPYGNPGYQPMPGTDSSYGYQPNTGYPSAPPYQNFPNPAYGVGYQPNPYGNPQPTAPGFSSNQYYQPQYQMPTPGSGYGAPPQQGQPMGFQGSSVPSGQYPQSHQYPYGQGEALQQAQHSSMLSAEPVSKTRPRSCD